MINDVTSYDDDTLNKARRGLARVGIIGEAATEALTCMQNQGILFRERTDDTDDVSDGFHTFGELYDHRRALTAALAFMRAEQVVGGAWRSKAHHPDDDPMFDGGYFIIGIELPTGTISYHYKLEHWDDFVGVPVLEHAPRWDGHTPADVVDRLDRAVRTSAL